VGLAGAVVFADTGPLVAASDDPVDTARRVIVLGDWIDAGSCIALMLTDGKAGDDAADSEECSTLEGACVE
jgi:hypothetical protein